MHYVSHFTHLFNLFRCISGTRVVDKGKKQEVSGISFSCYGSHCDAYPHVYLTAAAAIGTPPNDVDEFCIRLVDAYNEFLRKHVS